MRFTIKGHPNILATHPTTLEFTKDPELTLKGDCILGVSADFDSKRLKQFLGCKKIKITIKTEGIVETIAAKPNPQFDDAKEMVIRLGTHQTSRTFAFDADKAAKHISRHLVSYLKDPRNKATVEVLCADES
ncbi:MAG: DUF371 domain-containing protein [Nanoarchaeota archaeon]